MVIPGNSLTGFVFDDQYLQHNPGLFSLRPDHGLLPFSEPVLHPSNYRLVWRTKQLLDQSGLSSDLVRIAPYMASREDLTLYHSTEYVDRVFEICQSGGGDTGRGAPVSKESWEVSLLAAGGAMAAVDAVMEGRVRRAFANVRPPGHHAMREQGMGFCVFNNIAIAARHAQRKYGVERVLIIDWDVHDGNGTQDAFYRDPGVLFFSLHQDQLFPPGFGQLDQVGEGDGIGYTVNIPLPAGCGDRVYEAAFKEIILPVSREFSPQLVLISAGQDASVMDPLGRMCLSTDAYRMMTDFVIEIAEEHAEGRLAVVQEGGYSEVYAPYCTVAIIERLMNSASNLPEPLSGEMRSTQPHAIEVGADASARLAKVRETYRPFWNALSDKER